ncbi:MAG TPA: KamA family radical SAM protein [Ktedonobacteraceae bacterium]|nr:KamA family radical SAM protein [Ktedonobacteraceae bacterium]
MVPKTLNMLADVFGKPVEDLEEVSRVYPFAITSFLIRRVEEGTYSPEALRQFIPDIRELQQVEGFSEDPTHEENFRPKKSVLHVYDNRTVIILSHRCLVYCRFCFRKFFVGFPEHAISDEQLNEAFAYVMAHPEIEDVILSGGDPLAVPNRRLIPFLRKLTAIPHIKVIRIDSRAISTHPERIDDELIDFLRSDKRFWYYAHMNHPDDIDHPDVFAAINRLVSIGVVVRNQCVILRAVNDNVETMTRLMNLCYQHKVQPYNLYIFDRVRGGAHFDVSNERIVEICAALSQLPGPAQPVLVYTDELSRKHRAVYDDPDDLQTFLARRDTFLARNIKDSTSEPVLSGV